MKLSVNINVFEYMVKGSIIHIFKIWVLFTNENYNHFLRYFLLEGNKNYLISWPILGQVVQSVIHFPSFWGSYCLFSGWDSLFAAFPFLLFLGLLHDFGEVYSSVLSWERRCRPQFFEILYLKISLSSVCIQSLVWLIEKYELVCRQELMYWSDKLSLERPAYKIGPWLLSVNLNFK